VYLNKQSTVSIILIVNGGVKELMFQKEFDCSLFRLMMMSLLQSITVAIKCRFGPLILKHAEINWNPWCFVYVKKKWIIIVKLRGVHLNSNSLPIIIRFACLEK
jgi:hypothetical protein